MTEQRKVIVQVLADSKDHPDVELVYKRASEKDKNIGIATVYRTIRLFEENNIIEKHEFKDGRFRYEEVPEELVELGTYIEETSGIEIELAERR